MMADQVTAQEAPDATVEALRAVIKEIEDWTDYPSHEDDETFRDGWRNRKDAALDVLRDALRAAAHEVAEPAGLEADIDLPTLAEAIRQWYVETGRNPVTKNWDQPQAGWLIAKYRTLRARLSESHP